MAPTRPEKDAKKSAQDESAANNLDPKLLLQLGAASLEEGDLETAVAAADSVLQQSAGGELELPALDLLGHIYIEAGEIEEAHAAFTRAVALDEDGSKEESVGGGPEKFLWLAQLSEAGGQDSVRWFERGAASLRVQIQRLEEATKANKVLELEAQLDERRRKLAGTLCGVAEVYMTDLSWEEDAEQRCEALVTEATMVAPGLAEAWQTVANVRISQQKMDEARAALKRSLEIWSGLPAEHADVPDFPTRISLSRLLLEVDMDREALDVLERLVGDDDESVEAWYLGGWGQFIVGEKLKGGSDGKEGDADDWKAIWRAAQTWLGRCLKLFEVQEYEDERLGEHAKELLATVEKAIGPLPAKGEEDEWEDAEDSDKDKDQEMTG